MAIRAKRKQIVRYFSTAEVAQMLGWRTERAKKWLIREGAAVKRGRNWYTTDRKLMHHFPESFREVLFDDE